MVAQKVRNYRTESVRVSLFMEPSEVGLLSSEEACHGIDQDGIDRDPLQPTRLLQGQEALDPPIPCVTGGTLQPFAPPYPVAQARSAWWLVGATPW